MKMNKNLLAVAVAVASCVVALWFSTSIHGSQTTYELRPQVGIGEHRTDIVRVIDAYERLMERCLDLTERNSAMIGADVQNIALRLDSIDDRLAELSARAARIETALGIKQPAIPARPRGKVGSSAPNR